MKFLRTLSQSFFTIAFFAIGFFSLTYFITTSSQANTIIQLGVDGQLMGQSGGSVAVSGNTATLEWFAQEATACQLFNQTDGSVVAVYPYSGSAYSVGVMGTLEVTKGNNISDTYRMSCVDTSGGGSMSWADGAIDRVTINWPAQIMAPSQTSQISASNNALVPNGFTGQQATFSSSSAPTTDLAIDAQLDGQTGGSISVNDTHQFTLSWDTDRDECVVENVTTSTTEATFIYNPVVATHSDTLVVDGDANASSNYSYTYKLTCNDTSGPADTDTVKVTVTVSSGGSGSGSTPGGSSSSSSTTCPIEIDYFDLDQDDVYEDESDNDVSLSWSTNGACSYECELRYDGDTYPVSDNDNDYDVYNVDKDLSFRLECFEIGNTSNDVRSTENLTYHSASSSSSSSSNNDDPTIITYSAQDITNTSARLRGFYNDNDCSGLETQFEFGTSTPSMSSIGNSIERNGSGTHTVQLQNLTPGTTYFYRLEGTGCGSAEYGDLKTFTTTGSQTVFSSGTTGNNTQTIYPSSIPENTTIVTIQEVEEDGSLGQKQPVSFSGIGYVPQQSQRNSIPFGTILLVLLAIIIMLGAGKYFHDALRDPDQPLH